MDPADLPLPPGPFDGREAFETAVRLAVAQARRRLCWADRDLSDWPIEEAQVAAALARFLASRQAALQVLVRDERWLAERAPRLAAVRRRAAGTIEVRRLPADADRVDGGLVVVDARHVVERFHSDYYRGRLAFEAPTEAQAARQRFDAWWDASEPCLPATTLGL